LPTFQDGSGAHPQGTIAGLTAQFKSTDGEGLDRTDKWDGPPESVQVLESTKGTLVADGSRIE
jgi:hypothetical protein